MITVWDGAPVIDLRRFTTFVSLRFSRRLGWMVKLPRRARTCFVKDAARIDAEDAFRPHHDAALGTLFLRGAGERSCSEMMVTELALDHAKEWCVIVIIK